MTSLAGKSLASTFSSLLKLEGDTQTLAAGGASAIQIKTGDNEATPLYLNTNRLGVGTAAPGEMLDINGNLKIQSNYLQISNSSNNSSIFIKNAGSTGEDGIHIGRSSGTADIYVGNTGLVGIGTSSPDNQLDIHGAGEQLLKIESDDNNAILHLDAHTSSDSYIQFYEAGYAKWSMGNDGSDSDIFKISTGNLVSYSPKLSITSLGYVGIGTIAPATLFEIEAATPVLTIDATSGSASINIDANDADDDSHVLFSMGGSTQGSIKYAHDGIGTAEKLFFNVANADRAVIDGNGYFGIGNTAPLSLLSVGAITTLLTDGTTAVTPEGVNVHITEASKYAMGIKNADASGDGLIIQAGDASDDYALRVEDYDSANDLLVVRGDGNIGIGTSSPVTGATKGVDIENTTTNSTTEGGCLRLGANDGAVMVSTNRLGVIEFAGAEDTGGTMTVGAKIEAVANATWSGSENGASLDFYTTDGDAVSTQRMTILDDGKVGIGTTFPETALDVVTGAGDDVMGIRFAQERYKNDDGETHHGNKSSILFGTDGDGHSAILMCNDGGGVGSRLSGGHDDGGGADCTWLTDGIRIGSDGPNNAIDDTTTGDGSIQLWIGDDYINVTSDERIKKDIDNTTTNGLEVINKFRVVDYTWNYPEDENENNIKLNSRGRWTGFIAQEVVEIAPYSVNAPRSEDGTIDMDSENIWGIRYEQLVPILTKAIQELSAKVTALENA